MPIKLKHIIQESSGERDFEKDYYEIRDEVESEWWGGQKHQSWKLVPARDLLVVWNTFAKYGRADEHKLEKIWDIIKECVIRIIINSDWWNHGMAELFGKDDESELTSQDYDRFALFMSDRSGSNLWRGTGDAPGGMGRYSDAAKHLYTYLIAGYNAQTPEEKLMAIDRLLNFVHGSGAMAKWFVEGGVSTLNKVRDFEAKGIHLTGKLTEEFYGSFSSHRLAKDNYVEIFKNPSNREMKPLTVDRHESEFGAILLDRDVYVWDRDLALHVEAMNHIKGNKDDMLPIMVTLGTVIGIYVTDAARHTKWYRQPETYYYIKNHPLFKGKKLEIHYWDEDVNGRWTEAIHEVEFRKQKDLIHVADVPMFSVFVPATVKEVPTKILRDYYGPRVKDVLSKARHEIHRLGFPSMHANIVLKDLSKHYNQNTGEVGVAGLAHGYKKFMEIDPKSFVPSVVVHEWAHLWMMNNSKEFKKTIKTLYQRMMSVAGAHIDIHKGLDKKLPDDVDLKIIEDWSKGLEQMFQYMLHDRETSAYILKNKRGMTPDLFPRLPHLFGFRAKLKRPIIASNFGGRNTTIQAGTEVDVIKGNSGWLIGNDINNSRYEILTNNYNELFDYVESNQSGNLLTDIWAALKTEVQGRRKYNTPKYLTTQINNELQNGLKRNLEDIAKKYQVRLTPQEVAEVQSWSKYLLPALLTILRSSELLQRYQGAKSKDVYDALWLYNKHKPKDLSFRNLFTRAYNRTRNEAYKATFKDRSALIGKEFGEHRTLMAQLNKWVDAYGMSNEDELWATAVEYFFKLPENYRKAIIKIMMNV